MMKIDMKKDMKKSKRLILIILLIFIILLIAFITYIVISNKSDGINENLYQEKQVQQLSFKVKEIEYVNSFSNIILEVKNTSTDVINLDNFKIIFEDDSNNVVAEVFSYNNGDLEPDNNLLLSLSIDKNVTKATNIKYELFEINNDE